MRAGLSALKVEEYELAERHFLDALAIAEALPDEGRLRYERMDVLTLEQLGAVAAKREHFEKADAYFRQSLALREARFGESTQLWHSLVPLRDALVRQSRIDEALAVHERCVTILERTADNEPLIALAHAGLADVLAEAGDHERAIRWYELALEVREPKKARVDVAARLYDYATSLAALDRSADARAARERAAHILEGTDYVREVLQGRSFSEFVARWREDQMPLRVRIRRPTSSEVEDRDRAVAIAREAVLAWKDAVAEGIPRFEFVSQGGDIVVDWNAVRVIDFAGMCSPWLHRGNRPMTRAWIMIVSRVMGVHLSEDELRHVLLHEVGHALGLLGHSPYEGDVMFAYVPEERLQSTPSARDLTTLRRLYRQEPGRPFKW